MLVPENGVLLLAVLFLLAFIAGSIRLLRYCLTNRRVRLRLFLATWFLVLSAGLLRIAWISFTFTSKSLGQAMAALNLGIICFAVAMAFGVFALSYIAPTIWALLKRRRPQSSAGVAPAHSTVPILWPEALLFTLIVLPLLGITWLTLVGNYPVLTFRAQIDHPIPWLKASLNPPANIYTDSPHDWADTSLYTESSSGRWVRIAFPYEAHYRGLAALSSDSVLITWPASLPLDDLYNNRVGAVYKKGLAAPAATVARSDEIAVVPSGGFTTVSCEPAPRCQDHSCHSCDSLTVRRFDSQGTQTVEATLLVPLETELCDWWPVHRLMGDDLVYSVYHCQTRSNGEGYYRASASGIQRITSRLHSDQYTSVDDRNEMESLTQPITWHHIPWIHDPT